MVFTVLAAVDLGGKCNFELTFPTLPTISELRSRIDEVMSKEAQLRRPPQAGPFRVHRAQVFDERMEMWVDLVASSQLEDYCQVYIFQKETPWHKDTPGRIPPPVKPAEGHYYTRSSSPPAFEGYSAPLYSDLQHREGSGSPYNGGGYGSPSRYEDGFSPRHAGANSPYSNGNGAGADDNPTKSEMTRFVYEELDQRKSRAVTLDEWVDFFDRLRLSGEGDRLTPATVEDLFRKKADKNEDGVVSFPEFQSFTEVYPKLVESMYFRTRRQAQETVRKDRLNSQYDQLSDAERRHDDARQAALDAETEGLGQQQKLDDLDREIQMAKEAERAADEEKRACHGDSEAARQRLREAKAEEAQAKENIKKREAQKRAAQRSVEGAEKKQMAQVGELDRLQRELDALMRRVQEKEREIQRQQEQLMAAQHEVDDARMKADEADDPALEDEARQRGEAVRMQEDDLKHYAAAENEKAGEHRNAQRNVVGLQQQKQQLEKDGQGAKAKEQQKKAAEQRAEKSAEDLRRAIERNETREAEEDVKRDEQEAKENELLQMEVRLREQREAVERKEEHLRTAHRDFTQETGRTSPQRGNLLHES
eukprot:TRINITY_DN12226_c0_g2_i1.p1 TRINITY_DN12226_c0_g2~~TRINITY_DN12226_c0_g2_i1.p1  ORF type:complete len:620 (+),score=256.53 TRINITY_DN12226_c0_g2_i1:83-1861(+)